VNLYALSVFLHVVAATTWVGSMVFFSAVVVPVIRTLGPAGGAPALVMQVGRRYRVLGWIALAVLVVTGITNLALRGIGLAQLGNHAFWSTAFGHALAWKVGLVGVVLLLTAGHEIATPSGRGKPPDPASPEGQRARRHASLLGRAVLLVSLAILYFATALVRGYF
jgi:putative copper export protein